MDPTNQSNREYSTIQREVTKIGKPIYVTKEIREDALPHTYEFGPIGNRHKIKYRDEADGKQKIKEAMDLQNFMESLKAKPENGENDKGHE